MEEMVEVLLILIFLWVLLFQLSGGLGNVAVLMLVFNFFFLFKK